MTSDTDDSDRSDLELSQAERDALHEFQLAIEYVHRAYGDFLAFHHQFGHAMDRMANGEHFLREAGHDGWADELRDDYLPTGAVGDRWTYELVEEFSATCLAELEAFEAAVREDLADGLEHVSERDQQRRWRERAAGWRPDSSADPDTPSDARSDSDAGPDESDSN